MKKITIVHPYDNSIKIKSINIDYEIEYAKKLRLVAQTLRNNSGIKQIRHQFMRQENEFCLMGFLAFRAGIPKEEINGNQYLEYYNKVYQRYGFTDKEINRTIDWANCTFEHIGRGPYHEITLSDLWKLNDYAGWKFDEVADWLDKVVDKLDEKHTKELNHK